MTLSVLASIDRLLGYFNRGVLDVPDGLLHRDARFSLNGVAYESWLGRSADDPLVRLIARGPAGYRFVAQAVLRALDRTQAARGEVAIDGARAIGAIVLSGTLRGSGERFEETVGVVLTLTPDGVIAGADVTIDEAARARLGVARQAP